MLRGEESVKGGRKRGWVGQGEVGEERKEGEGRGKLGGELMRATQFWITVAH